jgi:hypothetical protein
MNKRKSIPDRKSRQKENSYIILKWKEVMAGRRYFLVGNNSCQDLAEIVNYKKLIDLI